MPHPQAGENRKAYIKRAIRYIMEKEGGSHGYAWHKAKALWNKYRGKK